MFGAAMGFAVVCSACGSDQGEASQKSTAKSTKTTEANTAITFNPTTKAVLSAYRAEWSAYDHALATANAYDSSLPVTMVNPLLQEVRAALLGDQNGGIVGRGRVLLHPKVTSLTPLAATIVDCIYSSSDFVYAKTGKLVPPITQPEHELVHATLVFSDGSWKVSKQTVAEGKCSGKS
jgi:hypothetical protein